MSDTARSSQELTTKTSPRSVADTVTRLTGLLDARGMKVFAVIDQAAEARQAGLHLRPTTLVIFGNPVAGTAVMDAAPEAAIDLPLKNPHLGRRRADEGHLPFPAGPRRQAPPRPRAGREPGRHRPAHRGPRHTLKIFILHGGHA